MTRKTSQAPPPGALDQLTATAVGKIYGVSRQAVSGWQCPKNSDGTYRLSEVIKWREERIRETMSAAADVAGGSPKEQLTQEQVRMVRLRRLEKEGTLLPVEAVQTVLGKAARAMRQAGDRLQRRCSPEAFAILEQALKVLEREIEREFGK